MNLQSLLPYGIAAGLVFASKYVPNAQAKAAMYGVAGVIVARQLPYIRDYI